MLIKIWKYYSALGQANFFLFFQNRTPPFALHFLCFALRGRQWLKQILHKHSTDSIPLHKPEPLSEPPTPKRPIPMLLWSKCCLLFFRNLITTHDEIISLIIKQVASTFKWWQTKIHPINKYIDLLHCNSSNCFIKPIKNLELKNRVS